MDTPPLKHVRSLDPDLTHLMHCQFVPVTGAKWSGSSSAARRMVQNRLNQQARRRRLREKNDKSTALQSERLLSQLGTIEHLLPKSDRISTALVEVRARLPLYTQKAYESYYAGNWTIQALPTLIQVNFMRALRQNAIALGIAPDSLSEYNAISPFNVFGPCIPYGSLPIVLQPTPRQAMTVHHPWIDLLPSPRMRDNILKYIASPKGEMLCTAMIHFSEEEEKPALIVWGNPVDPFAWEVSIHFLRSWSFLLKGCDELFFSTNWWRERRGEKRLDFACLM